MSTSTTSTTSLLSRIEGPDDVRALPSGLLPALAHEIREFLVEKVCAAGGHLGPNLGVVELTVALHRVFDSPREPVLFDIGHQAYVHKILTGRQDFGRLRQRGGLSGYLRRAESAHDWIENSHASTVLGYADGLARARALSGIRDPVVAVIGDGALTGGMAWEALNNLGTAELPVIAVLNDNGRSYAPTGGGLGAHLAELRNRAVPAAPAPGTGNVFTGLGLAYLGPVDGHDVEAVESALREARALHRPVVVHTVTVKGKGYSPAEDDEADRLHAVGRVDPLTATPLSTPGPTWTSVFAAELAALGAEREDLVALTASMLRPTGLLPFAERFPERVFDVGIAEQHAVAAAAGLALGGRHPVVALYATFLNRAFDQVLMDVALHGLPVTFVLDRAGITGPDGPSHHGMWDLTLLGAVPGLRIAAPRDGARVRELLREAVATGDGPTALRLPKASAGEDLPAVDRLDGLDILHSAAPLPPDVLLVGAGAMAGPAVAAARGLAGRGVGVTVADPRWVLPVRPALVRLAARHRLAVSVEDGGRTGGAGAALAQACAEAGVSTPVSALGLPRDFLPQGSRAGLLGDYGLDEAGITAHVLRLLRTPSYRTPSSPTPPSRTP
ncbi:1-deoxy-D-xylulose-5-phosphate synthase [Streptomyces sp. NPDC057617]|uniref:1-deoxy-D-xylulose-5-phosphate synthase n=1 Tax=Streptomyces sp. NPDC057617 TaxID=3346184 RepID=UPI0036BDB30F